MATLVAVVLAVVLLTRPSTSTSASTSATSPAATPPATASAITQTKKPEQPRTAAAARRAAAKAFDAYAAGDYGEFWDGWTRQAQRVVTRKDYVRRFKLCPSVATGIRWQIQKVTLTGERATVRAARAILVENYTLVHQGGRWRFQPQAESLQPYRTMTIEQIVRQERAEGGCG
ncbi:hypothetical protein HII36_42740 [Nonomuraea sp. NN258]|uniref:hypothetical protein n=1 Tax=Nonomuraea antri TaxID=2730852 RepID=UPI0015682F68|nr:hypothetical protein [Nonomuraea antri]NRQ38500.1 hypothetical protein [Nonomuraea antri]